MGMISDFFIASAGDVKAADWDNEAPVEAFSYTPMKGLGLIELGTLEAILANVAFEQIALMEEPLWESPEGESWVFELPQSLTQLLAKADDNSAAAQQWSKTEELKRCGFSQEDADWVIGQLSSLAKEASNSRKKLFVWMCL